VLSTAESANRSIGVFDEAIRAISKQRADLGAYYNRLEHAAKGLMNAYENTQASESRIRDTDMAETTVDYTKYMILIQTGSAMLAQANAKSQLVLELLR
jgi:flagellin